MPLPQSMLIRTFQKQRKVKKTILSITGIIVGAIILLKITNYIYVKIITPETVSTENIKIWNDISFIGKISNENKFPIYTHIITNTNDERLYLKSSSINLNQYNNNKIEIVGTIKDIYKGSPVLEVHTIKLAEQWVIIKNNIYFFAKDLLYIDFSNQNQLSAQRTNKEIIINYDNKKLFTIERFLCSRVLKNKSCTYLIEDYGQTQKENFDSYRGYTFYKHWSWLRTVFDGNMFGYIFKNVDDSMILDMSSMIRIIDKNFISNNKQDQIKQACTTKEWSISQITFSTIRHENDNQITLIVDWDIKKKVITCEVTFDMRNERKIQKVKIHEK